MTPKKILSFYLLLIPALLFSQSAHPGLFPVRENGLWGFIDTTGKVVIACQFLGAGDFSDGLAPVRAGGRYGYINQRGKMVIQPQFDYAEPFVDGLGKVWVNDIPFFVDHKGQRVGLPRYSKVEGFAPDNPRAIVTNQFAKGNEGRRRMGLIDRRGQLKIDTAYRSITMWTPNRYICYFADSIVMATIISRGRNSTPTISAIYLSVLDSNGVSIVPAGTYSSIKKIDGGLAAVEIIGDTAFNRTKTITSNGHLLDTALYWRCPYNVQSSWSNGFGLNNILSIPQHEWRQKGNSETFIKTGWMDQNGRFIEPAMPLEVYRRESAGFANNRVFGLCRRPGGSGPEQYVLLGTTGARISERVFSSFIPFEVAAYENVCFWHGEAVVKNETGGFEIIDTMGKTLLQLDQIRGIYDMKIIPMGDFWMIGNQGSGIQIWNRKEKMMLDGYWIDVSLGVAHQNQLIRVCKYPDELMYLDRSGKIIWQDTTADGQKAAPIRLNNDHLLSYLSYTMESPNPPSKNLQGDSVQAFIAISDSTVCSQSKPYRAFKGYFLNNSTDTLFFKNPYIGLELQDETGKWRDVIYRPSIICGTGRDGQRKLAPGEMYQFCIPNFDGERETYLRLVVGLNKLYYSNAIQVRANPGQFWRRPTQSPSGVIQPYSSTGW